MLTLRPVVQPKQLLQQASKLEIDGAGGASDTAHLPIGIRGTGNLWDTTNDKITPMQDGDSYVLRIDLYAASKVSSPTALTVQLDIGGTSTPTNVIAETYIDVSKATPFNTSISLTPIFIGATFLTNGGQIFLTTDTGTLNINEASVLISRIHGGTDY